MAQSKQQRSDAAKKAAKTRAKNAEENEVVVPVPSYEAVDGARATFRFGREEHLVDQAFFVRLQKVAAAAIQETY